ncbi:MAG: hypothetical protein ABIP17_02275, partial [Ilumatobacteraceae bacterium]
MSSRIRGRSWAVLAAGVLVAALGASIGSVDAAGTRASSEGLGSSVSHAGVTQTFVVVYRAGASSTKAAAAVAAAGGTLVANYREIGVVVARSSNPSFASAMARSTGVEVAASTAGLGVSVGDDGADSSGGPLPGDAP